ncbi:ankyrin repeat-containing domain protein [Chaetomium tenue]|uniref:Ankyrin repeat-containing domain protein n=1 Tax=Chaetomium tenue TaxID=1854479 RepID=A0ACB7PF08_9PEZI|nr:ankyrin repeat-containing domain protein [Chaetomium globosum]
MPSDSSTPKKRRQSLLFSVKSIFKGSKPHTGAGPAPESPWSSNTAGRPENLPTIHEAVRDNDILAVDRVLVAFPQSLDETDDQGMTPLALAFLHNNLPMATHLHTRGASPLPEHNNEESLACFAVIAQNPALIHWLASLGQTDRLFNTPGPDGNYPLHQAVLCKNLDVVRALLEGGADPNLHAAQLPDPAAEPPTTKTLLGIGTPLFYILDSRMGSSHFLETRFATLQLLLQHSAAIDIPQEVDGTYPLHEAIISGWPRHFITTLLDHQPQQQAAKATTPATTTTTTTTPPPPPPPPTDIVNAGTLLGSPPRDPALRNTTPLMYAAGTGRAWLVRLLLDRGANPHATNALGETPLHWAGVNVAGANAGNDGLDGKEEGRFGGAGEGAEIIRLLVEGCGVDVDVRCETGATPLHGAAYRGRMENVRALLELGADWGVVARDLHYERLVGVGGTPEEMARGEGGALEAGLGGGDGLCCRGKLLLA